LAVNKSASSSPGVVIVSRGPPVIEIRPVIDIHMHDQAYLSDFHHRVVVGDGRRRTIDLHATGPLAFPGACHVEGVGLEGSRAEKEADISDGSCDFHERTPFRGVYRTFVWMSKFAAATLPLTLSLCGALINQGSTGREDSRTTTPGK